MKFLKLVITLLFALAVLAGILPSVTAQDSGDQVYVEATVATELLYVRSGPGTGYAILGELRYGTVVGVLARSPYNPAIQTWVYVRGGGLEGWVSAAYLLFPEGYVLNGVPERTASGTTTAPTTTGSTDLGETPAGALTGTTADFVNLREGPGLEFNVMRQYPANTPVIAIGRNFNAVWINVTVNGQRGWMFYQLVNLTGNRNSLPVTYGTAPDAPATTTTTAPTTTTTTTSSGASPRNPNGTYNIGWGPAPGFVQTVKYGDGRINKGINLGVAVIYCLDANHYVTAGTWQGGGIIVYHYTEPAQGVVFFATDDQISAAGNPASGSALVHSEAGYSLYRLPNGRFQLVGSNVGPVNFTWYECVPGPA